MQLLRRSRTRILHHQTIKPPIVRFPHSRMHTHIRRNPTQHQIRNTFDPQLMLKRGMRKSRPAWLVDYLFMR